jgi:hypothetical protein
LLTLGGVAATIKVTKLLLVVGHRLEIEYLHAPRGSGAVVWRV